jgi:hypothetical protein
MKNGRVYNFSLISGHGEVVSQMLPKHLSRVRVPLPAQKKEPAFAGSFFCVYTNNPGFS